MKPSRYTVLAMFAAWFAGACTFHGAETPKAGDAPPGEVWVTQEQLDQAQIKVGTVTEQVIEHEILASGRVTFDDTKVSHAFSPVSGRVTRIFAPIGAHVKRGDPLALIESPDIGVASSDVGKAQADLVAAEHNFERQKRLFADHAASEMDFEAAEDNYRRAKAEMDRAVQRVRLMHGEGGGVSQGYTLRAEIDGEVMMRGVNPGMEVQSQYSVGSAVELFTIGTTDKVWVLADVFEIDLARVKAGSPVRVTVISYPDRTFTGQVDWVSGMLDPNLRTAKVRCTFDNQDRALRPEMYATVRIGVEGRRVVAVPRKAVFRMGDQTFAFIERGPAPGGRLRFQRYPVVADEGSSGDLIEVQRGLQPGERVVVTGAPILKSLLSSREGAS